MNQTNFKRQWRAEQKAVSPTDKRAIHDLIEKRRGVPHMTLKGLVLSILPQVD